MNARGPRAEAARLPDAPGIYKFYNSHSDLIYVGKANSLRKRVASYFSKADHSLKTRRLVSEIEKIEFTLSNSEADALLLENNFIKQYQPRYNILLKDDKTFPYLCILKERFPRIISTRKYIPRQGEYFGPYSSVVAMNSVLDLIRKLYTIRTCSLALSESNISAKKFKICLEFHIGNCKGPCEGRQSEDEYMRDIEQARNTITGNLSQVDRYFRDRMKAASKELRFEEALHYKEKLELLERFQSRSTVVNRRLSNIDVFALRETSDAAFINYLQVQEGSVIRSHSIEVKRKLQESPSEILTAVIPQIRDQFHSANPLVLVSHPIDPISADIRVEIPRKGDKFRLVDLALKNAAYFHSQKALERLQRDERPNGRVLVLQKDLRLPSPPLTIECFDNSNLQGSTPVASMVRFVNGKPDKSHYRHFNIKTVSGPDDFASMKEIVNRRYSKLISEDQALPDLIVVDGGKGQLASAVESLQQLGLYGKVPIVGIAKRLEEIYFPGDPFPLHIRKNSPGLRLVQHIRDEAHRFAITFHRQKRSRATLASASPGIPGIGPKTEARLLSEFRSWKKIREQSLEVLTNRVGVVRARRIKGDT
jgi:excinuclease ABC subunit C